MQCFDSDADTISVVLSVPRARSSRNCHRQWWYTERKRLAGLTSRLLLRARSRSHALLAVVMSLLLASRTNRNVDAKIVAPTCYGCASVGCSSTLFSSPSPSFSPPFQRRTDGSEKSLAKLTLFLIFSRFLPPSPLLKRRSLRPFCL